MENKEQIQQEQGQRGRKSATLLLLLILLVTITVGFAVLSTSLSIRGNSKIKGGDWCVGPRCNDECEDISQCSNPPVKDCTQGDMECTITDCDKNPSECPCVADETKSCIKPIDCTKDPDMSNSDKCKKDDCTPTAANNYCQCTGAEGENCREVPQVVLKGDTFYFSHELQKPGEVYTSTFVYTNGGNVSAKVTDVVQSISFNTTAQKFMTYSITYANGNAISSGDVLGVGSSAEFKVTVAYKSTVTTLPTAEELAEINGPDGLGAPSLFTVTYGQN